jgi:Haem-binding domain
MLRNTIWAAAFLGVAALLVAQLFRPARENPASDPAASFEAILSPPGEVQAAMQRACGDCHSNHTVWPWYSHVAPVSWLVARDVNGARARLNLSAWNRYGPASSRSRIADMCEEASAREMPPWYFTLAHPQAKLSEREVTLLCALSAVTDGKPTPIRPVHHSE